MLFPVITDMRNESIHMTKYMEWGNKGEKGKDVTVLDDTREVKKIINTALSDSQIKSSQPPLLFYKLI